MKRYETAHEGYLDQRRLPAPGSEPEKIKAPPDYTLPVGSDARPAGRGWFLVDYDWNEDTGNARLVYRNRRNTKARLVVEVAQPAGKYQAGWTMKPAIDRPAVLARYFESQREQMVKQAAGAYGR